MKETLIFPSILYFSSAISSNCRISCIIRTNTSMFLSKFGRHRSKIEPQK
jgi:hypothetical protein